MRKGLSSEIDFIIRSSTDFFDLYVITQGGSIRRTALPGHFWFYAAWIMGPHTDIPPEMFDESACREADESRCGYAEALFNLVDRFMDDQRCAEFLPDFRDKEKFARWETAFVDEQKRREGLWREAHNEWRKDLPPALD